MTLPDLLRRARRIVAQVSGMPDYAAYVAHLREHHPECTIPDEKEYLELFLKGRYEGAGTRCC